MCSSDLPLAYVFLAAFAFTAPAFAFHVGRFFDTNRADLAPLFDYMPWLLVVLMPALAAAIAHDPAVLILDEPTDGLDPNQKDGVRQLIRAMAPDKAIIISTHILEEVPAVCSRAIVIAKGRLLFDGTPRELAEATPDQRIETAFRELTTAPAPGAEAAA